MVIGTFAIYRHTVGDPSGDELDAIEMITDHVARAILMSRDAECVRRQVGTRDPRFRD